MTPDKPSYPLFAHSDSDATFRVVAADSGVHVRIDLDQDPELEQYGESVVINIAEPYRIRQLITALLPFAGNAGTDEVETPLDQQQQQRQAAIYTARTALASGGNLLSKGDRIDAGAAPLLVALAGFIATGRQDYLISEGATLDRDEHA